MHGSRPGPLTAGADAGFRVRGGASGVSRISGGGGCLRSDPIQKVEGGGGGGASGPIYEKWGGGGRFRSDIRKVGGRGGGGGGHSASGPIPLDTQKISYMYLPTCYLGILHTHARMNVKYMPAKVNLL